MEAFREGRRPKARLRSVLGGPDPVQLVDLLQNAKTVVAGVVAWVVATEVLGLEQAFLAPWAAVLVVHATVYRTVSRAGQQVVGTFLGVVLAWSTSQLLSPGWLAMAVMLAASFLIGLHRWMRDEGTNIATTGIVVLATNAVTQSNLLTGRLIDTTVGIVVGLAVNLLVWPPLRDQAAWSRVQQLPQELASLLAEMADGMRPDVEPADVDRWVAACRDIDVHVDDAWSLVRQAKESTRLNPRRSRPAGLDDLVDALHLLEQAVADTLSMARTVATSAENATLWSDDFRTRWKELLTVTAAAAEAGSTERLAEVRVELSDLADELSTDGLAHSAWHEYGGLLVNLRNVARALAQVAEWSSRAGDRPRRSKRYDVPRPLQRADLDSPVAPIARRLPRRRQGYPEGDDRTHT